MARRRAPSGSSILFSPAERNENRVTRRSLCDCPIGRSHSVSAQVESPELSRSARFLVRFVNSTNSRCNPSDRLADWITWTRRLWARWPPRSWKSARSMKIMNFELIIGNGRVEVTTDRKYWYRIECNWFIKIDQHFQRNPSCFQFMCDLFTRRPKRDVTAHNPRRQTRQYNLV